MGSGQGGSPRSHPWGRLRGLARGSPGPHPRGVSRPTPGGGACLQANIVGGLQAHTQGGLKAHTRGGLSPGPHPGGSPGPHPGGNISQHALRHTPPADGYCRGRYASYWNAFLLVDLVSRSNILFWLFSTSGLNYIRSNLNLIIF